jgi:hypothetical protein
VWFLQNRPALVREGESSVFLDVAGSFQPPWSMPHTAILLAGRGMNPDRHAVFFDLSALQERVGIAPHDFAGVMVRGGKSQ